MAVDAERWASQLEETSVLLEAAGLGDVALRETLLPGLPQLPRLAPTAVAAALAFLEEVLGSRGEAVAAVLEEPSLLACDVEEHLSPAMEFLQNMAGARDAAEAGRMVAQSPGLLRWAVEGCLRERQLQEAMRTASAVNAASAATLGQALFVPGHLRQVYTLEQVFTSQECDEVLAAVRAAAAANAASAAATGTQALSDGWETERHAAYATTDLPCSAVPAIDAWVRSSVRSRVFPELARRHGWLPAPGDDRPEAPEHAGSRLAFRDLFFVRYTAGGQSGLALHRDGSVISFNILLNRPTDFEGGGTFIEADDRAYLIGKGDCFVHSGKLRHGGNPVTRGERFVLVGFIDVLEEGETLEADDM